MLFPLIGLLFPITFTFVIITFPIALKLYELRDLQVSTLPWYVSRRSAWMQSDA